MRKTVLQWLGREFIALSCEGRTGLTAAEQAREIFERIDGELRGFGLSLENAVRTRLWVRDRESRNLAGTERTKILSGKARAAGSSYISPSHFDSGANVALDLLAMRPSRPGAERRLKEYDPPMPPPRYLTDDSIVFLSGVTASPTRDSHLITTDDLANQVSVILSAISASLADAGTSWNKAVKITFVLHRSQRVETLRELFEKSIKTNIPRVEYCFADGYATEGRLLEVELTAAL